MPGLRLSPRSFRRGLARRLSRADRGSVALLFALSLMPIMASIGIAVDYSFYIRAQTQLNLAADAAALDGVRVASQAYRNGQTQISSDTQAGQTAATQWFQAQLGSLPNVNVPPANLNATVTYSTSPPGFTATVSYSGTVTTLFGSLFHIPTLPISGSATSTISDAYLEVIMLVDNSSSMLIGATTSDISTLEHADMCSTQSAGAGQNMSNYSWGYTGSYGYNGGNTPPPATSNGACSTSYTGVASLCFYAPTVANHVTATAIGLLPAGSCTNGGGTSGTFGANTPQAPCGFACHWSSTNNDYYGLARSLGVTLRLDVVLSAAENVISMLIADQEVPNQFAVGVYQFNKTLQTVYPLTGTSEADSGLSTALAATEAIVTPVSSNQGDTSFSSSVTTLLAKLTPAGDGTSSLQPLKNIFIVTDGVEDDGVNPQEPITTSVNESICKQFKSLGFTVYVLYTPYLPLPNPWYFGHEKSFTEPTANSTLTAALQACASSPSDFYQASDPADINTALQAMLKSAVNSPGRIAQ